jgi:hypothetical protein
MVTCLLFGVSLYDLMTYSAVVRRHSEATYFLTF